MVKPRQIPTPDEDSEEDMEPIAPLPRSASSSESELDEYIHLGEEAPSPEEDIFADVPEGYPARRRIEALYRAGVTAGCTTAPLRYCPEDSVTREQMAVFLLRAKEGPSFTPPACTVATFADVPCTSPFAPWVYELARRGITSGCDVDLYCPAAPVTREQMAVFLLATADDGPIGCAGTFVDVSCGSPFAGWIQRLVQLGITAGCAPARYCPSSNVTRAQMAIFLGITFGIPL